MTENQDVGESSVDDDRPDWWQTNESLRREMDLADYEPPRFADGTFTHEVVDALEARFGCDVQFRSDLNPRYPEDWEVRVDLEPVARIGRHRNEDGNTVYETTPSAFRETIVEYLEGRPAVRETTSGSPGPAEGDGERPDPRRDR